MDDPFYVDNSNLEGDEEWNISMRCVRRIWKILEVVYGRFDSDLGWLVHYSLQEQWGHKPTESEITPETVLDGLLYEYREKGGKFDDINGRARDYYSDLYSHWLLYSTRKE